VWKIGCLGLIPTGCKEQITTEEIIGYCQKDMAKSEVPTLVEFSEELPKTHVRRLLRKILFPPTPRKIKKQPCRGNSIAYILKGTLGGIYVQDRDH
jgi:hypothetical protein